MAFQGRKSQGNPMRWDCERDGCFNKKRRPKTEVFHDCFTRGINFGDVDGQVEIGGKFLQLEWKDKSAGPLKTGQRIAMDAYTRQQEGNAVIVLVGDAETMEVSRIALNMSGNMHVWTSTGQTWREADLAFAKALIKRWRIKHDRR